MKLKNVSWILPLFLAVSCSQTPNVNTNPSASSNILGTVSLGIGADAGGSSVHFSPRVALPDNAITVGSPTFVTFVDNATTTRYLSATFPITNATATAFTNLTLYAYNKNNAGIGGTAIESMINFNGGATDTNAQSLLPIHKTVAGIPNPTIDQNNADFQAFNLDDIQVLTPLALSLTTITASDTILQYGFVARNSSGGRAIAANGGTGTVTIAYKLPDANVAAAYKFKADFVLANELVGNTRVSRGLGDTTSAANIRATAIAANEVFLVGNDTDTTTVPPSQRVTNILTSTTPVCLVQTLACSLTTTVSSTGTGAATVGNPYSIAITATPAAGTALTSVVIAWGDTTTSNPALPVTSASHIYAAAGSYTITITATDSNADTGTETKTVNVI